MRPARRFLVFVIEIGDQLIAPRPKSDQTDGADVTDTEYYYIHLPLLACISAI